MSSVSIYKFVDKDTYVIHPSQSVKFSGSYAIPPYFKEVGVGMQELMDRVLEALSFSKESAFPPLGDSKTRLKEFLKGVGVKTMKELHQNSIHLFLYTDINNSTLTFVPFENKGPKEGFSGYKEDMDVKVPFNSPKEELVKALELALSRCK